ncbi:MAG: FeoA family protein [Syntrophomonadaceae bacterium]|jgi:ferrous iron transport protein A
MSDSVALTDIAVGESACIANISANGKNRRRLLDLGLIPGSVVTVIRRSPSGNPTAYLIKGALIALRNEDASQIIVNKIKGDIYD